MGDQEVKYRIVVEGTEDARRQVQDAMGGGAAPGGGGGPPAPSRPGPTDELLGGGKGGARKGPFSSINMEELGRKTQQLISGDGVAAVFSGTSLAGMTTLTMTLMGAVLPLTVGLSLVGLRQLGLSLQNYSAGLFKAGTMHELHEEGFKFKLAGLTEQSLSNLIMKLDMVAEKALPTLATTINGVADGFVAVIDGLQNFPRAIEAIGRSAWWAWESAFGDSSNANRTRIMGESSMFFKQDRSSSSDLAAQAAAMNMAGINSMTRYTSATGALGPVSPGMGFLPQGAGSNLRQQGALGWPLPGAATMNFTMAESIQIQAQDEYAVHEEMLALKNDVMGLFDSMRAGRWMRLAHERSRLREGLI